MGYEKPFYQKMPQTNLTAFCHPFSHPPLTKYTFAYNTIQQNTIQYYEYMMCVCVCAHSRCPRSILGRRYCTRRSIYILSINLLFILHTVYVMHICCFLIHLMLSPSLIHLLTPFSPILFSISSIILCGNKVCLCTNCTIYTDIFIHIYSIQFIYNIYYICLYKIGKHRSELEITVEL